MTEFKLEKEDYYLDENGNMVFTELFLRKRKFCCKSGCRHCPYGFGTEVDENTPTELMQPDNTIAEPSADDLLEIYKDFEN